jgi:hypothetical protein
MFFKKIKIFSISQNNIICAKATKILQYLPKLLRIEFLNLEKTIYCLNNSVIIINTQHNVYFVYLFLNCGNYG